jgi:hypothetical protein
LAIRLPIARPWRKARKKIRPRANAPSQERGGYDPCPLYPQKRTLELSRGMSALCQKQTHAVQQSLTLRRAAYSGVHSSNSLMLSSEYAFEDN